LIKKGGLFVKIIVFLTNLCYIIFTWGCNGFDREVEGYRLRAELFQLVKLGKPIIAEKVPTIGRSYNALPLAA
jgi:hypothetical protein